MLRLSPKFTKTFRALLLAGLAAVALSACASNRTGMNQPDFSGQTHDQATASIGELGARYQANPKDKAVAVYYAAALRAVGQNEQAASVLEVSIDFWPNDPTIKIAYAKALTAAGRFEQALTVLDGAIVPQSPDWNALSVKGAVLDQMGRNQEARALYTQGLLIAPNEASLEANLGLSYAMTNELPAAEQHLRRATQMRGANSKVRQNLALVIGLQGRFDEARAMYASELPPEQVETNMAYIRALLTQQNRWDVIAGDT